jgi:hypothetical protein
VLGLSVFPAERPRRSRSWIAVLIAAVAALLVGAVACNDTTAIGFIPTTGILIRAETLSAGKGCGAESTQLFRYVVVVYRFNGGNQDPKDARNSYTTFQAENVFDCDVDGEFVSLPNNVGNNIYRLEVYAFNKESYDKSRGPIEAAVRSTNDTDPANDQASSDPFKSALPTWSTECIATQNDEVETLAQCDPLSPGLGGIGNKSTKPTQISLATASFDLPDGRRAVCVPGAAPVTDAGSDADAADAAEAASDAEAGTDAGTDAGDAAIADAETDAGKDAATPTADAGGAVVAFTAVRVRPRIGGNIVHDPVDVLCSPDTSKPYLFDVPADPASYTIDVGLIDSAGVPLGQTACAVTTTTGAVNVAACQ